MSHRTLLQYPKLYCAGHRHEAYNLRLFCITMCDTLWQSLVLFYIPLFTYKDSSVDIWSLGSLWTIAVVILVNIHLAMDIWRWVFITHVAVWGSIIITYACMVVVDSFPILPNYWLVLFVSWKMFVCLFPLFEFVLNKYNLYYLQDNLSSSEITNILAHHLAYNNCRITPAVPFQSCTTKFPAFRYPDSQRS